MIKHLYEFWIGVWNWFPDWSQIALRHRGTELTPSLAFKIDSVSGNTTPHEITAPDAVWR